MHRAHHERVAVTGMNAGFLIRSEWTDVAIVPRAAADSATVTVVTRHLSALGGGADPRAITSGDDVVFVVPRDAPRPTSPGSGRIEVIEGAFPEAVGMHVVVDEDE